MKKIIAMLLALVMVFALVACGDNGGTTNTNAGTNTSTNNTTNSNTNNSGSTGSNDPVYEDMGTIK